MGFIPSLNKNKYSRRLFATDIELSCFRDVSDFLCFCCLYSDVLVFNSEKEKNEFIHFLEKDDLVIYSLIVNTDVKLIKDRFTELLFRIKTLNDKDISAEDFVLLLKIVVDYIYLSQYWYDNLSEEDVVRNVIMKFNEVTFFARLLVLHNLITNTYDPSVEGYKEFVEAYDFIFKTSNIDPNKNVGVDLTAYSDTMLKDYTYDVFRDIVETIIIGLSLIRQAASDNIDKKLYTSSHNPHITLLLVFYKLLTNNFSFKPLLMRHLDFYYTAVLKFKKKKVVKDSVLLFCWLNEYSSETKVLPAGTKVDCGDDSQGNDIIFSLNKACALPSVRIKAIKVYKISTYNIGVRNKTPKCKVEIGDYDMNDVYNNNSHLYLFSSRNNTLTNLKTTSSLYPFSYIISSPLFVLTAGERKIHLEVVLSSRTIYLLNKDLSYLDLEGNTCGETANLFLRILKLCVAFYYTSEEDYVRIPDEDFTMFYDENKHSIICDIDIGNAMQPFSPLKSKPLSYGIVDNPFLQLRLGDESFLWAWVLIADILSKSKILISVNVIGFSKLILQNDYGVIDNRKTFQPFGVKPNVGSNFYVGSDEVFNKKLDKLTVNVEWAGIPTTGFMRYYYNYDRDIKTSDFKVSLSYLNKRNWVPKGDNKQVFNLFDYVINYERSDEEVKSRQSFDIDLNELKIDGATKFSFGDKDFLSTETTNGFLKFQLISPPIAFGHSLYQDVFIKNALKKKKKEDLFESNINIPYTPEIATISVDYSSSQVVDVKQLHENNDIKIVTTSPFGFTEKMNTNAFLSTNKNGEDSVYFYREFASVYIGVEKISKGQFFKLYFLIDSFNLSKNCEKGLSLSWEYLSDDKWIHFNDSDIVEDGTKNMSQSGNISFRSPRIESKTSTLFAGNNDKLIWIRLTMKGEKLPLIINIYTNSITATRTSTNNENKLPAYSASKLIDIEDKDIVLKQPIESFGGRNIETDEEFYVRISERLKHKGRAVCPSDYVSIIFDRFKEIKDVKCLPCSSSESTSVSPGSVTLVVIPDNSAMSNIDAKFPLASAMLLENIKREVITHSSPFVNVNVINPYYEEIKIIAKIKVKDKDIAEKYKNKLNFMLRKFISPWLFDNECEIKFDVNIRVADLFNFIKAQPEVDCLWSLMIIKKHKNTLSIIRGYDNIVVPTTENCIFYSAAQHKIIIDDNIKNDEDNSIGIGNSSICENFIIGTFKNEEFRQHEKEAIPFVKTDDNYFLYFRK